MGEMRERKRTEKRKGEDDRARRLVDLLDRGSVVRSGRRGSSVASRSSSGTVQSGHDRVRDGLELLLVLWRGGRQWQRIRRRSVSMSVHGKGR
jgi:hypothetical protein